MVKITDRLSFDGTQGPAAELPGREEDMDKVQRMLLEAKKTVETHGHYIVWTLVRPDRDTGGYKGQICYYANVPEAEREEEYVAGQTRDEVCDKVEKIADKHGQKEVMFMHFNF